jgi:EpsI family protein
MSVRFAGAVLLIFATVAVSRLSEPGKPENLQRPLETVHEKINGFVAVSQLTPPEGVLRTPKPASYLSRMYQRGGRQLELYIAFYSQQRPGESMYSPRNCLPGSGWEIQESGTVAVRFDGRTARINKCFVQNGSERRLVLYWYQSKGRIIASEYLGKILMIRDALVGRTAGSITLLTLRDQPGALEDGLALAAHLLPLMQDCLGG